MPTGDVSVVSISQIKVVRDERIRREIDPKRVSALADSIGRIGLIHFPVIDRDYNLVSGETRLRACESIGWDRITIQWSDTLTPEQYLEIEFEENVKRTDLPWQDQCDALKRYHDLKKTQNDGWRIEDTAESIGVSYGTAHSYLSIAKEIASGNERVKAAPKLSTAAGIVRRKAERAASDESAFLVSVEDLEVPAHPFLNVDFSEWVEAYSGPPFNLLHCDFPYGIGADKFNQGAASSFGGYSDTFEDYEKLLLVLKNNRAKLFGDSAHMIFWFSMKHYQFTLSFLKEMELWVDPYPLIWNKSDNKGTLPDPERGPRRIYEVAFLASWGDRKITSPKSNLFSAPTVRTGDHMSEKNETMIAHFLSMLCDEHTRFLDPTAGSGSALRAARSLGVTNLLGLERDPEFFGHAVRAWNG